jgi:ABC-type polar amino acid transport system ATPase subunit
LSLIAEGISKSFGRKTALNSVSIRLDPSELVVLTGPSGSGKTTLLNALANIDPPDRGTVNVDGILYVHPLQDPHSWRLWPMVTMVFQQLALWPHLSLRRNLTLPLEARGITNYTRRMNDLVDAFGMTEFLDRWPGEASAGERQRVAIARALLLEPKYLLLDEVFSALDIELVYRVNEILNDYRKSGVGMILVTHLIGLAKKGADRIIFFEDGAIVEETSGVLLDRPKTKRFADFIALHAPRT